MSTYVHKKGRIVAANIYYDAALAEKFH